MFIYMYIRILDKDCHVSSGQELILCIDFDYNLDSNGWCMNMCINWFNWITAMLIYIYMYLYLLTNWFGVEIFYQFC